MRHLASLLAFLATMAASAVGLAAPPASAADRFPEKPITILVPFSPGSATDISTRRMAQSVGASTGWTFVVENKPGANGFIAAEAFVRAPSDGHTLIVTGTTTHAANPHLFRKLPYDPFKNFVPLTRLEVVPQVLLVQPGRFASVRELADHVKRKGGGAAYGTGSETGRAAAELFLQHLGTTAVRVPFVGSPVAMTNLIGGHIDFLFTDLAASTALVRDGRLKALAVASPKRVKVLGEVPTMVESGYEDFLTLAWTTIFAQPGLPPAVFDRLQKVFHDYAALPATQAFVAERGGYIEAQTPQQATAWIRSEYDRYKRLYERLGVEPQ